MKKILLFVITLYLTLSAALWQSTKVEVHRGYSYVNPFAKTEYDATVVSFSHANGWKLGDNFFWFDATRVDDPNKKVSVYGEFAPRLSIFKIAKMDKSDSFLKDFGLAAMIEFAPGDYVPLYGIGTTLNIPKFSFFNLNGYIRNDPDLDGVTFMVNIAWSMPLELGAVKATFDGFLDYAGEEGKDNAVKNSFLITQPALLLDVGNFWKNPGHVYVGSEIEIWVHKLGVKDESQVVPQLTFRWQF